MERALVLIHAFPVGAGMWAPQHDAFPGWTVITPSLPGFDGMPGGEASVEGYARAVLASLDAAGIRRAVVAGVSMGGYVAFAILRLAPDRVAGLVLADTRSGPDSPESRAGRVRSLEVIEHDGLAGLARDMVPKLLGETTRASQPAVVQLVRQLIERQSPRGIAAAVRALMDRPDSTPLLAGVMVPTLILVGEEDVVTPPSEAELMRARIPGALLVPIPRAGHLSNLENPAAFNDAIRTFLA